MEGAECAKDDTPNHTVLIDGGQRCQQMSDTDGQWCTW